MSRELITIDADADAVQAAQLMADKQIRRLPVVEGDRLVGIVSLGDFAIRESLGAQASIALEEISESHFSNKPC
jgi:CBS-domain-containing membrane protein